MRRVVAVKAAGNRQRIERFSSAGMSLVTIYALRLTSEVDIDDIIGYSNTLTGKVPGGLDLRFLFELQRGIQLPIKLLKGQLMRGDTRERFMRPSVA